MAFLCLEAKKIYDKLKACGIRVKLDDSNNSPGWKFAEYEMKGVPVRVEIGPKDIENGQCVVATRYNGEKITVSLENMLETLKDTVIEMLEKTIPEGMYKKAAENRENKTYRCKTMDEIKAALEEKGDGFVKAMWCD